MRFIDPTGMGPDDFVNGVVTGVQNVVKGIANAVEDPVQTIKTVKDNITVEDVVCSVLLTPAGNTLLNAGKAIYNGIDGETVPIRESLWEKVLQMLPSVPGWYC